MMTRSTLEWEMSRSCQRGMFSMLAMALVRNRRESPHRFSALMGFFLCGMAICAISILAFCNIAIFYGFYSYLTELGVAPHWRGPLLSLEPLTALVARPFLGRYLTLKNGVRFMRVGMGLATCALVSYPFAHHIALLAAVRVLHGLGFVMVVTGLMGTLMAFLPKDKMAQGFGLFSVTILVPYAIMPPFVELLLPHLSSHGWAYALAAPLMLPAFLLLAPLGRRTRALAATLPAAHLTRPGWDEVRQALRSAGVVLLVAANFFLVAAHAIVFFFMRDFAVGIGAANPGEFFTFANAANILLRVGGGRVLDKLNMAARASSTMPTPESTMMGISGASATAWRMKV